MKNVKYLIKEARENTNTTDKEAISDEICINLLNRSLRYLIATLYNLNVRTKLLRKEFEYNTNDRRLSLPSDIYAKNAIISLRIDDGNNHPCFLDQISDKNRSNFTGYIVEGEDILVTGVSSAKKFILAYAKKIPLFGKPFASVIAITPSTVEMSNDKDLGELCEKFTIVDRSGNILMDNIGYYQSAEILTVDKDVSSIPVGALIIPGEFSTTHCPLPEELDVVLVSMLEAFIQARQSSLDLPVTQAISSDYISTISELFSDNSVDVMIPPIQEYSEWV